MIKGVRSLSVKSRLYTLPVVLFVIVYKIFYKFLLLNYQQNTF